MNRVIITRKPGGVWWTIAIEGDHLKYLTNRCFTVHRDQLPQWARLFAATFRQRNRPPFTLTWVL